MFYPLDPDFWVDLSAQMIAPPPSPPKKSRKCPNSRHPNPFYAYISSSKLYRSKASFFLSSFGTFPLKIDRRATSSNFPCKSYLKRAKGEPSMPLPLSKDIPILFPRRNPS